MSRTRTPLDLAESQALARIASLAAQVMVSLHSPGRGVYDSERVLRSWLTEDGCEFSNVDLSPALAMLEASGRIGRSAPRKNVGRCGWLVTSALEPPEAPEDAEVDEPVTALTEPVEDRIFALSKAVLRALLPGDGRSNRCPRDELPERLTSDGVIFDPDDLSQVLSRLHDVGQLQRVQRQPFSVYPQFLVLCGDHPYDETDALAADVCASVKEPW